MQAIVDPRVQRLFARTVSAEAPIVGVPVSAARGIDAVIEDVGASEQAGVARWGEAGHVVVSWVLTILLSGASAYLVMLGLDRVLA